MDNKLKKALEMILEDMQQDCCMITFPEFVEEPKGKKQDSEIEIFDHEYVDQRSDFSGENYAGYIYYPFEDHYIKVGYAM